MLYTCRRSVLQETAENMFYTCWKFGWPDGEADEVASGVRDLLFLRMSGSSLPLDGHPLATLWEKFRQRFHKVWVSAWEEEFLRQALNEALALVIQFVEDNESDNEEEDNDDKDEE